MYQKCKFNEVFDIQKTRPSLSTSIRLAMESGVVLDTGIDSVYNDIENPTNIWGRVTDVFTALDVQKRVLSGSMSKSSNVSHSQPVMGEGE